LDASKYLGASAPVVPAGTRHVARPRPRDREAPDFSRGACHSLTDAARNRHIQRDPHVALNFDGNGQGGDIVVITGEARIVTDVPPADQMSEYVTKYQDRIARSFGTPANFAAQYSVAIRITPTKVRGF
jgi:PPOX class probable F420-dependent enzyme